MYIYIYIYVHLHIYVQYTGMYIYINLVLISQISRIPETSIWLLFPDFPYCAMHGKFDTPNHSHIKVFIPMVTRQLPSRNVEYFSKHFMLQWWSRVSRVSSQSRLVFGQLSTRILQPSIESPSFSPFIMFSTLCSLTLMSSRQSVCISRSMLSAILS